MNRILLAIATFVAGAAPQLALADDGIAPTYEKHVGPFLKTYCLGCHDGGDDSKGGLSVITFKSLMEGGDSGEVIVPGKSDESRLVKLLLGTARPKMPPKDSKQPRSEEIEIVKRWVDLGAKGPISSTPQSAAELNVRHIEPKGSVAAAISSVAFSPDGRWLAAARHHEVLLIDAAAGRVEQTLAGAENPINSIAFSPDGRRVAAAEGLPSVVGNVRLWEIGGKEPRVLTGHVDSIYAVAFNPAGDKLVTASYDKLLILWEVATAKELHALKHHTAAVFAAAFSPDGKTLVSAAADQTVKLWNVETGQRITTLTEPTKGLNAVAFHPRGHEIAAAGSDKMIRIYEWNGTVSKLKRSSFAHDAPILALAYSPDGATLFSGSEDRRIKAWDSATLQERHVYDDLPDWPLTLAINHYGTQLAAGFFNGDLTVFDAGSAKKLRDILKAGKPQVVRVQEPTPTSTKTRVAAVDRDAQSGFVCRNVENRTSNFELRMKPPLDVRGSHPEPIHEIHPTMAAHRTGGDFVSLLAAAVFTQVQAAEAAEKPKPNPPAPRLDAVSPRTVVRGSKVKFTLYGQNIRDADRLFVSPSNLSATLLPGDEKNANQAFCEIEIPGDMQPGMVSVRLHTPLGSTAAKSFYVGPFAELGEKEDNGKSETATPATFPATLVGTIGAKGDRDLWAFEAEAGQELVFVLVGPSIGSSLNARLTLLDEAGRSLEHVTRQPWKSETVLAHRFEVAGRFFLAIDDRDFTGGGNHYYYIHAGALPYVIDSFPLGMTSADAGPPAGDRVQAVEVRGANLAAGARLVPVAGAGARFLPLNTPAGKTLNGARFESSPYPEFAETEPNGTPAQARYLPVPCAISGKISPATSARADVDHVSFDARRGERLTIEVLARRLGSPLDSVIDILDASGKPVPRYTIRAVAETYTVLRDHDSRSKGIRLQHWEDVQPNDLMMLGDEILKVQILPLGPDEDVKFFDKGGLRLGFLGTTPEAHAINSAAYKIEVHPPRVAFAPNGMPVVTLDYSNDDGGPGFGSDSQVLFDVPADGRYMVRLRDVRDLAGDDYYYRLVIRPRQEDFRMSLDPENPNIPRGGSLPVTVNLDRLDGFNGPVDVRIDGLPEGIAATPTRIGPDLFSAVLTLTASETIGEVGASGPGLKQTASTAQSLNNVPTNQPPGTAQESGRGRSPEPQTFKVIASARIGAVTVEHATTPGFGLHQVSVTSTPDLKVDVEPAVATISPGQELRFTVTIERRNAFAGRVPVDVLNLPHGLRVLDVGLNGVLINENEISRSFVVACDPWAESGPLLFYAAPKVEAKNERHASAPIRLEVRPATTVAEAVK
jgi:WD40 repeat protein